MEFQVKILLSIVLFASILTLFAVIWAAVSDLELKKKKKFINSFRVIRYDTWYCIQQQNEVGDWYFIRNISLDTALRSAIIKKYIIRENYPNDYKFFYDEKTATEIVKILRENWDGVGVISDK